MFNRFLKGNRHRPLFVISKGVISVENDHITDSPTMNVAQKPQEVLLQWHLS